RYEIAIPAELATDPRLRLALTVRHEGHLARTIGPVPASDFRMQNISNEEAFWLHREQCREAIVRTLLRKARPLAGRVLLPDGSSAEGARVVTRTKYRPYAWKFHSPDDYSASDSAVTDKDGHFAISTDEPATLTVSLAGQAPLI